MEIVRMLFSEVVKEYEEEELYLSSPGGYIVGVLVEDFLKNPLKILNDRAAKLSKECKNEIARRVFIYRLKYRMK